MTDIAWEDYQKLCDENERLRERVEKAEDFIRSRGYLRCDMAACNCGFWHGGHASRRPTSEAGNG